MTNELEALKAKINEDGRQQFGPSTIDVDRAFMIYDELIERLKAELIEANQALVSFEGEFVALKNMDSLSDTTIRDIIARDHTVLNDRFANAINRAADSVFKEINPSATPAPEPSTKHNPTREGDEYYCPKCAKRWGFEEEPPVCVQ